MKFKVTIAAFILISIVGIVFNIVKLAKNPDNPTKKEYAQLGILFFAVMLGVACSWIIPV